MERQGGLTPWVSFWEPHNHRVTRSDTQKHMETRNERASCSVSVSLRKETEAPVKGTLSDKEPYQRGMP